MTPAQQTMYEPLLRDIEARAGGVYRDGRGREVVRVNDPATIAALVAADEARRGR